MNFDEQSLEWLENPQDMVKEIPCPISSQNLDVCGELCLDHSVDGFKNFGCLALIFHEKNPRQTSMIIDE